MRNRARVVVHQHSLPQASDPVSWSKLLTWGTAGNAPLCQGKACIQQ